MKNIPAFATVPSENPASVSWNSQWENRFEITNLDELNLAYRLVAVRGLPAGDHYDKNLNQLVKQVRYQMKQPVALVRCGDTSYLAIPSDVDPPAQEQRLMPYVVRLEPGQESYSLTLAQLDKETGAIAVAFLQYAFRRPLWEHRDLWEDGNHCYSKQSLNGDDRWATIDIYPGFVWGVDAEEDGRLYVVVDTRNRYIDRFWLPERLVKESKEPRDYFLRHCLYHFGHQWYVVQLLQPTGQSIAEQEFVVEDTREIAQVLSYTRQKCGPNPPSWIRDIDPSGPAVLYRYPGNQKERHGAMGLCKLTYCTAEVETANLHRLSTLTPAQRMEQIAEVVRRYFQHAWLTKRSIGMANTPLAIEPRVFTVPAQRFGHDRVLAVDPAAAETAPARPDLPVTDRVALKDLGVRRLDLFLSPEVGPLDRSPFDVQYLVMPYSLPRSVIEDFERRFLESMQKVSGQVRYTARRIMYDDRQATSLFRQLQAIKKALDLNDARRGYALLVLPPKPKPQLHHHIKAQLWPDIQVQCARAEKLWSHYEGPIGKDGVYREAPDRAGKFASYLRNCAFGMLVVNRKWPWSLAVPLHYDVYVGIDVLNRVAGVTFVYDKGQQIEFHDHKSKHSERLTNPQIREILVRHLREGLAGRNPRPRSLIIHRDGRTFASERAGIQAAVRDLQKEGLIPLDVLVGIVDIRKTTALPPRLVEGRRLEAAENPTIGSYRVRGSQEGIVCTTGWPFRFPGTARPLTLVVVEGNVNVEWVLEDVFALSQLVFTAPDRCERLPLTIKIADDLLEPIAAALDEDGARYDDGGDSEKEEDESLSSADSSDSIGPLRPPAIVTEASTSRGMRSPTLRPVRELTSANNDTSGRRFEP